MDRKYPIEDMIKILKEKSEYDSRKSEVGKFNKVDVIIKRCILISHAKPIVK